MTQHKLLKQDNV